MGSQILSQEGHTVVTVSDGDEAMLYLDENLPDLVMVDTRMPGPSGFEICKHIKSSTRFSTIKVVLLAGPLEPFDTAEAESAGPDGVLHKPLDAYTLIDTVNSLMGRPASVSETSETEKPAPAEPEKPRSRSLDGEASLQKTASSTAFPTDHFASAVEQVLGANNAAKHRDRVQTAVRQVLDAALPAIVERVTDRVIASLEEE
jgi:CheY-like chemotaxis protein